MPFFFSAPFYEQFLYIEARNQNLIILILCPGVYLPLLWEEDFCMKTPIALGYTRGHFSALVPMESLNERNVGASSSVDVNEDTHVTYLPLVDHEGRLLPIHFQTVEEVSNHLITLFLKNMKLNSFILLEHFGSCRGYNSRQKR